MEPARIIAVLTDVIQRGRDILSKGRIKSNYPGWSRVADAAAAQCFGARANMVFALSNVDGNSFTSEGPSSDLKAKLDILEADLIVAKVGADAERETVQERVELPSEPSIDVFLSHSKKDELLAGALLDLLRDCLEIPKERIRYTSGAGYRYAPGDDHDEEIRREVYGCKVFVGLLTPYSIQSSYVLFELGARWGANKRIAPLMACGVMPGDLPGPVKGKNAFQATKEEDVIEFLEKIAKYIGKSPPAMSGAMSKVTKVVELAAASESKLPAQKPPADASDVPLLIRGWIREHHERLSKTLIVRFQEIADELRVDSELVAQNFEHSVVGSGFVFVHKSAGAAEIARPPMNFATVPRRRTSRMDGLL